MKKYALSALKYILPATLALLLMACGGSGGKSTPPASSAPASVASASSMSESSNSSVPSSAPTSAPITQITHIGGTYVAEGFVNVLMNTAGILSVELQNKNGMTLYLFDDDTVGHSSCVSEVCITEWPPFIADENAVAVAPLTIIQRTDGRSQWALRGKPLYFYFGDMKAGDLIGEGVGGIWHVALFEPTALTLSENDGGYFTAAGSIKMGADRLDREGFSLYIFDADSFDVSTCLDSCLASWPALIADENDEAEPPYSIITRAPVGDNASVRQWAYQGNSLYFYVGDTLAGQTKGKAIANWHLARPQPMQAKSNIAIGTLLAGAGLVKTAVSVNSVEQISHQPKHGFTLYTFDSDTPGVSHCTGSCLAYWPALIAHSGAEPQAPYSVIARTSGEMQWALNGKPLYFYAADTKPGDINGEDSGGIWHVARIPPVVSDSNGANGLLMTAHGNIVNESGVADNSRDGFTLYTFNSDPSGSSVCNGGCITTWPPLFAPSNAVSFGDFSVIVRTGGAKQWAYKNKPLYFYSGDTAAGNVNGGLGEWVTAKP